MRLVSKQLAAVAMFLVATPATAVTGGASLDSRCITVSDVVILAGVETMANKRLCKSPNSARYDVVEVAAAVYAAATTQASFEQAADPKLRAQRKEIETLRAQMRESGSNGEEVKLALVRTQLQFIAALAKKDRAYAEAISQFRNSLVDIASTPEGLMALAQYNAGDEAGALAVFDQMRAANDAARKMQSDISSAVEGRRIAGLALDAHARGKLSTAAVIARYQDVTRLDPGVFKDWMQLARLFMQAGNLANAALAAERARNLAQNDREQSAALTELGEILMNQGELERAARNYQQSLAFDRKLAAVDPENAEAQRSLSIGIERIGNVQETQGNLVSAAASYNESLAIRRELAVADPSDARSRRDILVALQNIGPLSISQGNLVRAEEAYSESLSIARQLAAADPFSIQAQFALAGSLSAIGNVRMKQNDIAGAAKAFNEMLEIARKVAAEDPSNAHAQFVFATGLADVGDVRIEQKDLFGANEFFGQALVVYRKLAANDPSNANAQRDVFGILQRIGDLLMRQNDLTGTEMAYDESLAVARNLATADPGNVEAQHDLAASLARAGDVRVKRDDLVGAGQAYGQAVTILRKLTIADPTNAHNQSDLASILTKIGEIESGDKAVNSSDTTPN